MLIAPKFVCLKYISTMENDVKTMGLVRVKISQP